MNKLKNDKTKYMLILLAMIVLLTSFRLLWLNYHAPTEQPEVQDGILDLRTFHLEDDQTIMLAGEWIFYPEELVDPQHIDGNTNKGIKMAPMEMENDSAYPYGTYHLKILMDDLPNPSDVYSIRIPSANTASALYVNGQLEGESGVVAANKDSHKGKGHPYAVLLKPEKNEIDITLHLSNFDTSQGIAMSNSIKFGSYEAIAKEENVSKTLLIAMIVILFLHSLYSLLIYLFFHREKIILFFAVGFLLPAIDELLTYNSSAMEWLHLNYAWSFKFKELIYLGAAFFFVQLMRVLLTKYEQYKRFHWFTVLYGIGAILIMILPLNAVIQINVVLFALYIISFLSVVSLALREYFQYKDESFFIAVIVMGTTSGIVWGLIKFVSGMEIPFYPFDYLSAFIAFAVFWFQRFFRQNRQVVELVEELKQADKLKDDFLVNSTNKLWSPLSKMTTIAQMLHDQEEGTMTEKEKGDLKYLMNIGESLSFVLNDLLDFTRLKEQTLRVHPKNTNIHATISSAFDMLHFLADGKQIKLTSTVPAHFPSILADESRLIQVFLNILGHVIKYTNSGNIIVHADVLNDMAVIYVQDPGIEMDVDTQRVLSAYEENVNDDDGLGLKVSQKLIELHGGKLDVESKEGKGTRFIFALPVANEKSQHDPVEKSYHTNVADKKENEVEQHVSGKRHHILVVDDDPSYLRVISGIFPSKDYKIVTAISSKRALGLLGTYEWDLIMLDVTMPYMSGYELTEQIRERYSAIELPILLLTASRYPTDVDVVFAKGANDYVTKPIHSQELKSRSIALIELKQSISERYYMESAWLQAQIRPHFLFNTLNTIASLSIKDPDRMVTLLSKFGEYLRGSFKEENLKRVVPLKNELELVRSYLYIEKERFGERLQVKWEVDKNITVEIPPLSIQTLVENAVNHGLLQKSSTGTVCIRIKNNEDHVTVTVIDDGVGMDIEKLRKVVNYENKIDEGIGLPNTNRRLKRVYGSGLHIKSSPDEGTIVEFKIPKN